VKLVSNCQNRKGGRFRRTEPALNGHGARGSVRQLLSRSTPADLTLPIHPSTRLGEGVRIYHPELVNIYGATIGDHTRIGPFVEIQGGAIVGARCKIQSHVFIPDGVIIEDGVFIGHGVMFTNDFWPRAVDERGQIIDTDWTLSPTLVKRHAVIGSGVTLLPVTIGQASFVGAGSVVTHDVPEYAIVVGNPARTLGDVRERRRRNDMARTETGE
jgi:UDP-2-acetamido-3-amino-2,3-dideoxy-glucuronate N-acetyltransferase